MTTVAATLAGAGAVASPCVNVCRMDADSGLCLGCYRTLDEIARWSRCGDDERRMILAAVDRRRLERSAGTPNDD